MLLASGLLTEPGWQAAQELATVESAAKVTALGKQRSVEVGRAELERSK